MKIIKVLNNSTVIAFDGQMELVVMGKGISFGKRQGDEIDEKIIEKRFLLDSKINATNLVRLLSEIPIEYFNLVRDLVDVAESEWKMLLNETIYLTLTDHIYFAVERFKNGIVTPNAILSEIKVIYHDEYLFGMRVLDYIERQLNCRLPDDEAGFIALHFVIAKNQVPEADRVTQMTLIVHDIVQIVQNFYQLEFKEDDLNYVRFITHLKFFIMRLWNDKVDEMTDPQLLNLVKVQYKRAQLVLPQIDDYLKQRCQYQLKDGEAFYLILHINRLLSR